MRTRRNILGVGGGILAGLLLPAAQRTYGSAGVVEIHMKSDLEGTHVGFDPIGILIASGQTVRWICDANEHTTAAYHPNNSNHSLRIPSSARPWDSDYLLPGQRFEVQLTIEGIYDYFCGPHEKAGMVGRIIVGTPIGPGGEPFDYFVKHGQRWKPVPPEAQRAFPSADEILQTKVVPLRAKIS